MIEQELMHKVPLLCGAENGQNPLTYPLEVASLIKDTYHDQPFQCEEFSLLLVEPRVFLELMAVLIHLLLIYKFR